MSRFKLTYRFLQIIMFPMTSMLSHAGPSFYPELPDSIRSLVLIRYKDPDRVPLSSATGDSLFSDSLFTFRELLHTDPAGRSDLQLFYRIWLQSGKVQLFILIFMHSMNGQKGITTKKLSEVLWPGISPQHAKNTRGTNIQNLITPHIIRPRLSLYQTIP